MRNTPSSVMLFAAGLGTRMGTLTADRPKPMIPVAGKPLIDHALDHVRAYAPEKIVVNLHYQREVLQNHLCDATDIQFSVEDPDILETGGGLRAALPLLGSKPVITMNTDAIWQGANPLDKLTQHWQPNHMDALLLLLPNNQALGHSGKGDFIADSAGKLTRGPGMIYSGVQMIKTDLLHEIAQNAFSLNLLWDKMLAKKTLFGTSYDGIWCDVGRPECISLAEALLNGRDV